MTDDMITTYENKIASLEACIAQLKPEYERQMAINKRNMLENQYLTKEIEKLKGELEGMRILQDASRRVASIDMAPSSKAAAEMQAEMKQHIYVEVIEKLIAEAEQYPSNQNDKAEAIKSAIQSLMLAEGVQLPTELRTRLQNLGRKESTMARAMVEVTGNEKVVFGGLGNG